MIHTRKAAGFWVACNDLSGGLLEFRAEVQNNYSRYKIQGQGFLPPASDAERLVLARRMTRTLDKS